MKNFHSSFIEMTTEDNVINENESKSVAFTFDFDFMSPDTSLNQVSHFRSIRFCQLFLQILRIVYF
jgi:hypothetical protein